jgi:hypothetical protein
MYHGRQTLSAIGLEAMVRGWNFFSIIAVLPLLDSK